ncbi:MAG: DUF72 domain-containing protein [Nitrospiraceae bacterium]
MSQLILSAQSSVRSAQSSQCAARIGTSGWHYTHWRGPYYPPDLRSRDMLHFYVQDFDSVEINNSFYQLPAQNAFETWRAMSPPNFCFSVKASRYITHRKKLLDPEPALERFLPLAEFLGPKLGPILFQLPPRWSCNVGRLNAFLEALPTAHRYCFELRDPSWHDPAVYRVLRRYNAAFCIYELGGFHSPIEITADFAYVRLHGPGGKYRGNYPKRTLHAWARRIRQWQTSLSGIYFYFDNDQAGYAVKNAGELKQMLEHEEVHL